MTDPNTIIIPTVGRVVWYYPDANSGETGFDRGRDGEPLAAIIARVWSDHMVNLVVFDATGRTHSRTSVELLHDVQAGRAAAGGFCTWMPFQKGQAAKQSASAPTVVNHRQALEHSAAHALAAQVAVSGSGAKVGAEVRAAISALLGEAEPAAPKVVGLAVRDDHRREQACDRLAAEAVMDARGERSTFDFGRALRHLKEGLRVARAGWNGKGMFVYLNKGSMDGAKIPPRTIEGICWSFDLFENGDTGTVTRLPNINMRTASGATVTGWLASQADMLAEDWMVAE